MKCHYKTSDSNNREYAGLKLEVKYKYKYTSKYLSMEKILKAQGFQHTFCTLDQ